MRSKYIAVCAGLVAVTGVSSLAQQSFVPPAPVIRLVENFRPAEAGETRVTGSVADIYLLPVRAMKVQMRNLATGRLEGETITDDNGEYEFAVGESSTYVVEAILKDGSIGGTSNARPVSRFETVQTFIQLPGRWDAATQRVILERNFAWYLGVSGQTTLTAQTLELAIAQNVTPKDAGEPVSP